MPPIISGNNAGAIQKAVSGTEKFAMSYQNVSTHVGHLLEQGQFHLTGNHPQDAVVCLQEATRLYPLNAEPYTLLGKILAMQGDHAAAAASLRRAATLAPHAWENHALLGASLWALGRHREAVLCYRRALPLNAHNLELYACLAQLLGTVGKIDEAYQTLERAKARTGANGAEWTAMEPVYHSLRDCEDAQAARQPAAA